MRHPFASLTARGQIRRLRALAGHALVAHGFVDSHVRVLDHGENTTFQVRGQVRGQPASEAQGRYMLRVHRDGYQSAASIRSELAWLAALRRDTGLRVPEPVATRDGRVVLELEALGVPTPRRVVLFRWVHGRFQKTCGPAAMEKIGRLTAALHQHASAWSPPADFARLRWDRQGMLAEPSTWGSLATIPGLQRSERRVIERARDLLDRRLSALGEPAERFGLIHADLHLGNVLFTDGRAAAIDFDDCGVGYHLYDAAVTLAAFRQRTDYDALRAAYFNGYRRVRPLEQEHVDTLEDFLMARRLLTLAWLGSRSDNPTLRLHVPNAIARTAQAARAYVG